MVTQAQEVLSEAKIQEAKARTVTACVTGALAYGLREQGLTDKAIGEALGVSRNRVNALVRVGMWPSIYGDLPAEARGIAAEVDAIYSKLTKPASGWVHAASASSGEIAVANNIPLPPSFAKNPTSLDPQGAAFVNLDTGERIIVYTLERHRGQMLFNEERHLVGTDFKGVYRIDLVSSSGHRQQYPLEILGITEAQLRFGRGWDRPEQRRDDDDAYLAAIEAVRRHYGIWPRARLVEFYESIS